MRVSYNWLKSFVHFDMDPHELARQLTLVGLEVTDVKLLSEGLSGVLVGEITACHPHPNADNLQVCDISAGSSSANVVCGATNARTGLKSAFVPVGVTLPNGLTIEKVKLRGVESFGMLCSERELGISIEHHGIMELPDDAPAGKSLVDYLGLADYSLELDLTANRSDCLSHLGVAREVATLLRQPLIMELPGLIESGDSAQDLAKVTVENAAGCPRYTARVILGVKIGPSPTWLQQRLWAIGQRPINNVVDVTNYVLMELGHPLHAFDYDRINGHHIIVRSAAAGEKFTTLDGKEHTLTPDVLMIADENGGVAVGGVMGGLHSEVTANTTNILLESAYFDPVTIRKGARHLGMRTESSQRFEKTADPDNVIRAVNRAAQLIADVAGGTIAKGLIDVHPRPIKKTQTAFRPAQLKRVLGIEIPMDETRRILTSLGMVIDESDPEVWQVEILPSRSDITREIDLIEDVARHYGYHHVSPRYQGAVQTSSNYDVVTNSINKVKNTLLGLGYTEFITTSFVDAAMFGDYPQFGIDPESDQLVRILNPLTSEYNRLRPSLLTTILPRVEANFRQKEPNLSIFEIGRTFQSVGQDRLPIEKDMLGILLTGNLFPEYWNSAATRATFYDLKGVVETLINRLRIKDVFWVAGTRPFFHPQQAAEIKLNGDLIGVIGTLDRPLLKKFEVEHDVFWAEISLTALIENAGSAVTYKPSARYPAVERDLALVVDKMQRMQPLVDTIRRNGGVYLESCQLFDIYQGAPLPHDKKSLAFTIKFRSAERTLTDEETDWQIDHILTALNQSFGATLRS